jgi:hypothetical protein
MLIIRNNRPVEVKNVHPALSSNSPDDLGAIASWVLCRANGTPAAPQHQTGAARELNRPSLKMPLILRVCPRSIAQYADAMACLGRILLWTKVTLPPPELTETYAWDDRSIAFHRCRRCGCVSHWLPVARPEDRKGGERTADGPGHRRASAHSTPRRGGVRTGCRLRESHCRATMVQMGTNALLVLRTKLIGHLYSFR